MGVEKLGQLVQRAVETGVRQRWGEVGDEARRGASFRDRALAGVGHHVQVVVRYRAGEQDRPVGGGETGLAAGHELECAVGAEVQHHVVAEDVFQPQVVGGETVRRCGVVRHEQFSGVGDVPELRLHADDDVAEAGSPDDQVAAVGVHGAGQPPPGAVDACGVFTQHLRVIGGPPAGEFAGLRACAAGAVADEDVRQFLDGVRYLDGVALLLQATQERVEGGEDVELGRGADGAVAVVAEDRHRDLPVGGPRTA